MLLDHLRNLCGDDILLVPGREVSLYQAGQALELDGVVHFEALVTLVGDDMLTGQYGHHTRWSSRIESVQWAAHQHTAPAALDLPLWHGGVVYAGGLHRGVLFADLNLHCCFSRFCRKDKSRQPISPFGLLGVLVVVLSAGAASAQQRMLTLTLPQIRPNLPVCGYW